MWIIPSNPLDEPLVPLRAASPECGALELRPTGHGREGSERVSADPRDPGDWSALLDRVAAARASA